MSPKSAVLLTVFIDVVGLGIIIPVLPFYVESFNVTPFVVTLLFSVYAFCSFVSAPFLGALSDKVGRRPILLISIFSSAVGWFVFSFASSVFMLFLGRVIDGLAAGNISTARSYMVDMAGDDKKERMKAMGMIGAIFGMGFIIGPAIGGLAGAMHGSLPFFIVAIMSSINFFLAYFILPETLLHADTKHFKDAFKVNPFSPIIRAFGDKLRVSGYFSWLLMLTSAGVYQGIFAIYLQKVFGRGQGEVGLAMAITGVMMVLMQIYFLPKLTHAFEEVVIEKVSFVILIISFLFMAVPYITVFYFGMILSILSQSMLRVTINHGLLHNSESSQGEIMGVTGALMSVSMILGPLIAGFVFSFSSVLVFATASFIALLSMFSARNFRLKVLS